jgi:hypothetical protein
MRLFDDYDEARSGYWFDAINTGGDPDIYWCHRHFVSVD